jgi:solute carrier family 25 protein 38
LRQNAARSNVLKQAGLLDVSKKEASSSALPKLSNVANLGTGAVARTLAGFILMPVTVIKVRYESNLYAYKSMLGACKDILRTEGPRGFFSGFGATAIRDAPYAGLYVLFYEESKRVWSGISHRARLASGSESSMTTSTSATINFSSGVLAAGAATALTNPFDAIKTRIQLQPQKYRNMVQAAKLMMVEDGVGSYFNGMGLRMGRKALSSALAWTLYEELIRRAEGKLREKHIL